MGSIPTAYMASESQSFEGAQWQIYPGPGDPPPIFTLSPPSGRGAKTVYFKVMDANARVSPVVRDYVSYS